MKFLNVVGISMLLLFSCTLNAVLRGKTKVVIVLGQKRNKVGTVVGNMLTTYNLTYDDLLALMQSDEQEIHNNFDCKIQYFCDTMSSLCGDFSSYAEDTFYYVELDNGSTIILPESWLSEVLPDKKEKL